MAIFQKSVINKHLKNLDKEQVETAYLKFKENYSIAKIEKIKRLKEEEYQDGFLRDVFVDVFGYILKPDDNHNLVREFKNQDDGRKADGAILNPDSKSGEKAIAVIELKSTKTKDLKSITDQAFNYKNNQPDCKYVITSNFQKLRFYIDYANEFEEFDLFQIANGSTDGLTRQFKFLYLILNTNSIFSDLPLKLKEETKFHEQEVSDKLYKDYSNFKRKLFDNLTKNHPDSNKLTLFKKSQKLLDRFLFILFAEDSGLLPPNSISRIIKRYEILKNEDAYKPIYDIFKQYFGYMNIGRKGQTEADNIPAYNGGLFYPDELLDKLKIDDEILIDELLNLSEYDFNTEVDVNILGHIFEHSLSEIEEITDEIEGTVTDKTKSKRKKDGVFYTPKYITQYIVENTIGTLCNEKRKEIEIEEIEFDGTYRTKDGNLSAKGKKLYQKLKDYKDWLLSLKIVDPACGSGAFLNQALNYLIQEHKNIDDIIAELTNTALRLFDTDKAILENNLYGVDINEESIEIAKLSLWLRTAQKGRKLSILSNNIKCGNSLIDDPEIAGDKAFKWNIEFKEIMDNGGFDVVIGNPPYVPGKSLNEEFKKYVKGQFKFLIGKFDLYILFLEQILNIIKKNGIWGIIIPNTVLVNENASIIRKKYIEEGTLDTIRLFKDDVFPDASVESVVLISSKNRKNINLVDEHGNNYGNIETESIKSDKFYRIQVLISKNDQFILSKINNESSKLGEITDICIGIQVGGSGNSKDFKDKYISRESETENHKMFLDGKDFEPYRINWSGSYISYGDWLHRKRDDKYFLNDKILIRQIGATPVATIDKKKFYVLNTIYSLILKEEQNSYSIDLLFAFINSNLIKYYWNKLFSDNKALFPKIKKSQLIEIPIKADISTEIQNRIENCVYQNQIQSESFYELLNTFNKYLKSQFNIVLLSKKLQNWYELEFKEFIKELNIAIKKVGGEKLTKSNEMDWMEVFETKKKEAQTLKAEIEKTDKEIDQMVYELYGLSEEEIEIIEQNNSL